MRITIIKTLLAIVSLLPIGSFAQMTSPDPSVAHLYKVAEGQTDQQFNREHIPLDGAAVRYIPFRTGDRYGFVDKRTKAWVIRPKFSQVYAVYPEGAIVEATDPKKGHPLDYGLVDYSGKFLIQPVFINLYKEGDLYHGLLYSSDTSMAESFSSSIAHFYFNQSGRLVYSCRAHRMETFGEGDSIAWARYGPDFTVFNRRGKVLKSFRYDPKRHFLGIFNSTLVWGSSRSDRDVVYTGYNIGGQQLWEVNAADKYNAVYRLSDSMFAFLSEDGFFLGKRDGAMMPYGIQNGWIGNGFRNLFPVFNRMPLIPVMDFRTGKVGYVDRTGELVIPCTYKWAGNFYEGLAPYLDTAARAIGFIDTAGRVAVPAVVPAVNLRESTGQGEELAFKNGLCRVFLEIPETDAAGGKYFNTDEDGRIKKRIAYIDPLGNQRFVLADSIITAGMFTEGLAPIVGKSKQLGFMDTKGRIVIPMRYELAVAGSYPFPYIVYPAFNGGVSYLKAIKAYVDKDGYEYFSGKREQDHYDFSH